ncbi:MAG: cysteine dioxygenase family protein [Solirubrobacterales bacterium]|nr:cysteine dioxygenase family protein [Solirubrobacterales bacterium]
MTLLITPDLTAAQLRDLVQTVAAVPERWRNLVRHGGERHFACLHRDDAVEIWVVSWMPGHDTGFHDHDDSAAAILVADGAIREQRLAVGAPNVDRHFGAGQTFAVRPSDIHRVQHAGEVPSVTIHAYSPPLRRVGQYEVAPNGTLQRYTQNASEELKPIAT